MAEEPSSKGDALPRFDGEQSSAPRGPLLTAALAITGVLLAIEIGRLIARHVLVLRRPTEVRLTPTGIVVTGETFLIGKRLREHTTVIPRDGLVRATREARYPSLAMYAGLLALALGSYLGVGLFVDGARAASPSMVGTGLLLALIGVGLDFALSSFLPGRRGKSRVVLVPRRGRVLCVAGVDPARADLLLAELARSRTASASPAPVESPGRADRGASEPERKGAADTG